MRTYITPKRAIFNIYIVLFLSFLTSFSTAQTIKLPVEEVSILTQRGERVYQMEIADTPQERQIGLMNRTHLPQLSGMLFDYGQQNIAAMWMKNTLIPLDMLFVDEKGVIVHIHHRAKPHDLTPITANRPVRAVIELAGGIAKTHFIKVGDKVSYKIFNP